MWEIGDIHLCFIHLHLSIALKSEGFKKSGVVFSSTVTPSSKVETPMVICTEHERLQLTLGSRIKGLREDGGDRFSPQRPSRMRRIHDRNEMAEISQSKRCSEVLSAAPWGFVILSFPYQYYASQPSALSVG